MWYIITITMTPREFFRKLAYYRDLRLLLFVISEIVSVGSTPAGEKLKLLDDVKELPHKYPEEKLKKYVAFVYFIMARIFVRPKCFTNCVTVCRIFKKNGMSASVVFGCRFDKDKLRGHCWVELGGEKFEGEFKPVFTYP